jgi:hypothetical protein
MGHNLNAVFLGVVSSLAAGAVVWLFAFGGIANITDTAERAEFSSSPPWLTIANPHQDVADSAVLTFADLPPGWTLAADDDDGGDFDYESSEECHQLDEKASSTAAQAYAKSENMTGPERQIVRSDASVFAGAEAAQGTFEANRMLFAQCGDELVAALDADLRRRAAHDGLPPDAVQLQISFQDLGLPSVGETGMMFRIAGTVTGPAGSSEFAVDFIAFRHGRMLGGVIYTTFGALHPEEEQQIAQIAAAKLQTANASLEQS